MDFASGELRKSGVRVKIQEQPFAILEVLVMRHGEILSREELYSKLSGHPTFDSEHALNTSIEKIRKALGDSPRNSLFIETIPNRGYRFLLPVEFICRTSTNGASPILPGSDSFLVTLSQIWRELLAPDSERKLAELHHRVIELIEQYAQHPSRYEAQVLLDAIQFAADYRVCSQQNKTKHLVSFDTAAGVFDDPQALSLFCRQEDAWQTLGQVWQKFGPFRRTALLTVSHSVIPGKDGRESIQIKSARKATPFERKIYAQGQKKTNR